MTLEAPGWVDARQRWPDLRSLAMVQAERRVGEHVSQQTRSYLSSLPGDARVLGLAIRRHWGVENLPHGTKDVTFGEDQCRARVGSAAQNFARLRRCALNRLRREPTARLGRNAKRLKVRWSDDYLAAVLRA